MRTGYCFRTGQQILPTQIPHIKKERISRFHIIQFLNLCIYTLFRNSEINSDSKKKKNYLLVIHKNYVKKGRDEVLDMKGVFKSEFQPIFFCQKLFIFALNYFFIFLDHFDMLMLKIKFKKYKKIDYRLRFEKNPNLCKK